MPPKCAMRSAECGTSWRATFLEPCPAARRCTAIPHSAFPTRHLSASYRPVASQATDPGQAICTDPHSEPHDLPYEPTHDRVRPLDGAGEEIYREGEHGAEPQRARHPGHGRRQEGERRDPTGEEQGHARMELHDRGGARRPERQQPRGEADEEPHRG